MLPIHQIPLPTPWPGLGPVHVYLIRQDPVTLVDAGLNTPESREALLQGLADLRVDLRDIKRLLLTHAHFDHCGQAAWIAEQSGAAVYLHPDEAGKVDAPDWWQQKRDRVMAEAGVDDETFAILDHYWKRNRRATPPLSGWQPLADGQAFDFENGRLSAVHLPGHALGHTGFHEAASRTLIGGDHLLVGVTPNPVMEPVRPGHPDAVPHDPVRALTLGQFLRALDRVAAMDLDRVLPGHGPIITDHRAVAQTYKSKHERRLAAMLGQLGPGREAWNLTREVYPRVKGFDLFLALSEVLAHLDLLVVRGLASFVRDGARSRYEVNRLGFDYGSD